MNAPSRRSPLFSLAGTLTLGFALTACGGKGAPKGPAPATTPYAGVFVERSATYHFVSQTSFYDPDDPKANEHGNVDEETKADVICKTTTRTVESWQLAEIDCESAGGAAGAVDELQGTYVAGAGGLWRVENETTDAAGLATLAARPPLLAAKPVPVEDRHEEEDGHYGTSHAIRAAGAGWCIENSGWGGDESGTSLCIDPVRGITHASRYFAGGSSRDESLDLAD